jgi:ribosome-associated protein
LKKVNEHPISVEGYGPAEWILADYGDLLVHVFSTKAREYYDLERLWRAAKTVPIPNPGGEVPGGEESKGREVPAMET